MFTPSVDLLFEHFATVIKQCAYANLFIVFIIHYDIVL